MESTTIGATEARPAVGAGEGIGAGADVAGANAELETTWAGAPIMEPTAIGAALLAPIMELTAIGAAAAGNAELGIIGTVAGVALLLLAPTAVALWM